MVIGARTDVDCPTRTVLPHTRKIMSTEGIPTRTGSTTTIGRTIMTRNVLIHILMTRSTADILTPTKNTETSQSTGGILIPTENTGTSLSTAGILTPSENTGTSPTTTRNGIDTRRISTTDECQTTGRHIILKKGGKLSNQYLTFSRHTDENHPTGIDRMMLCMNTFHVLSI